MISLAQTCYHSMYLVSSVSVGNDSVGANNHPVDVMMLEQAAKHGIAYS